MFEFELTVFLRGKNRSNETPWCSKQYIAHLRQRSGHMHPDLQYHAVHEVVERAFCSCLQRERVEAGRAPS